MSYKVLEQNGVTNENVDGAGFNYFASGKRDGILGGILNECAVYSPASNIVSIKTGVISVQGFRVKITSDISWAASGNADEYSIVFEIVLNPDRSVSSQFIAQPSSLALVKDDLLASEKGTHQIEIIRFNWDGDAVSNISRRLPVIIAGSGSGGGSIELTQSLSGNEEDKAPSVKAVNDGLAGKVDKITKTWQAYTTDDNGNTVPKKLAAKPAAGGVVLYNEGGIVKTNAPVEDNDATNKEYVDNGFVAKTNNSWKIYGTGEGAAPKEYSVTYKARKTYLVEYGDVNVGTEANDGYLVTCDPVNPYHATNKRYVDRKCRDLQQGVYNALGVLYTFESVRLASPYNEIPNGALSFAYLESIGGVNVYSHATEDRVLVGTTDILAIHIYDANSERLSTYEPTAPQYIELPAGAVSIVFEYREPTVTVWDTLEIDASIKYQIKVGA